MGLSFQIHPCPFQFKFSRMSVYLWQRGTGHLPEGGGNLATSAGKDGVASCK